VAKRALNERNKIEIRPERRVKVLGQQCAAWGSKKEPLMEKGRSGYEKKESSNYLVTVRCKQLRFGVSLFFVVAAYMFRILLLRDL